MSVELVKDLTKGIVHLKRMHCVRIFLEPHSFVLFAWHHIVVRQQFSNISAGC